MKIKQVTFNNRKKTFEVTTSAETYTFPFANLAEKPSSKNPIIDLYIDHELGNEAFTYRLKHNEEETIHIDDVLEYNRDPKYMRDLLLYKLTLCAQESIRTSGISKRELIRRLKTSPAQLYRLLDQTNYRKTIDNLLALLSVLNIDVDFETRKRVLKHR